MSRPPRRTNQPATEGAQGGDEGQSLVTVQSAWSGPLPPPEALDRFNRVVPGSAERIIVEWEEEARHRRLYERRALMLRMVERIGGRLLAFIFAMLALGVAAYSISMGQPWPAAVIGGGTIASVVAALIYGRS
jgi:uncharacterized membrane protein